MSLVLTKAVIRGGQVEVDEPINLPDGSEVEVSLLSPENVTTGDDELSPQEIAHLLTAMDQMEPLELTADERAAWKIDRQARKEWEQRRFVERAEMVRRNFE